MNKTTVESMTFKDYNNAKNEVQKLEEYIENIEYLKTQILEIQKPLLKETLSYLKYQRLSVLRNLIEAYENEQKKRNIDTLIRVEERRNEKNNIWDDANRHVPFRREND